MDTPILFLVILDVIKLSKHQSWTVLIQINLSHNSFLYFKTGCPYIYVNQKTLQTSSVYISVAFKVGLPKNLTLTPSFHIITNPPVVPLAETTYERVLFNHLMYKSIHIFRFNQKHHIRLIFLSDIFKMRNCQSASQPLTIPVQNLHIDWAF